MFLSFLVSWFQRFGVTKFQGFKFQRIENAFHACLKLLIPYYQNSFSSFQLDIDPRFKISKIYVFLKDSDPAFHVFKKHLDESE